MKLDETRPSATARAQQRRVRRMSSAAQRYRFIASLIVFLLGATVLIGWTFHVPTLTSVLPGLVAMNPLTAVAFMACALALEVLPATPGLRAHRITARTIAAVVWIVSSLRLLGYVLHFDPVVDRVLFPSAVQRIGNRMAPNTALAFMFLSTARLFATTPRPRLVRVAHLLTIPAAVIGFITLVGYAYGAMGLTRVQVHIPMAIHTAFAFTVLSIATLLSRIEDGPFRIFVADTVGGRVARMLMPPAVVLPVVVGWVQVQGENAGWYGMEMGVVLMAVFTTMLMMVVNWSTAHVIERSDLAQQETEARVVELNRSLEERSRLLEEANRELEAFANETVGAAFNASPAPMFLLDNSIRVSRWNPAAERVFGWSASEAIGRPLPFTPDSEQDTFHHIVGRVMNGEKISSQEVVLVRKDGSLIHLLLSAASISDSNGTPIAIVGILVDVTEQRALEEQLRQTQKMEAVGRLAGGVAHDFNNVLTAIEGYAGLLLANMDTNTQAHSDVEEILSAAKRATSFTRQLLAFSRKQVLQPAVTELNDLLNNLNRLLRRMIGDNITLETVLSDVDQYVFVDKGQIEQIVINLVVNARDAVQCRGQGTITVRTCTRTIDANDSRQHRDAIPGKYCVLEVEDNGYGIEPQDLEHIFEPFFTTKNVGEGTGLGLSTVYGIARQNGGFVLVDSVVADGTRFSVFLPESQPALPGQKEQPPAAVPVARSDYTVLVVEDEPAIRQLIVRILKREHYHVYAAADPLEALSILGGNATIDVLLTDVMLPHMSGKELAERVKERSPGTRTLFMSGYAGEEVNIDGPFLEKPFSPMDLSQKLAKLLGHA